MIRKIISQEDNGRIVVPGEKKRGLRIIEKGTANKSGKLKIQWFGQDSDSSG